MNVVTGIQWSYSTRSLQDLGKLKCIFDLNRRQGFFKLNIDKEENENYILEDIQKIEILVILKYILKYFEKNLHMFYLMF